MTHLAQKCEDVKKKIRSLLVSAPVGLTMFELERDYRNMICSNLPFRELGYSSLEEFLSTIPDVVQMSRKNGVLVLTAVSSAETENIHKLVSKQKLDNKKHWGALGNRREPPLMSGRPRQQHSMSQMVQRFEPALVYTKSVRERYEGAMHQQPRRDNVYIPPHQQQYRQHTAPPARHKIFPVVPAYVQTQIDKLLEKYPEGLPLVHIPTLIKKHYGVPLDCTSMGFSNLHDLMASMPSLVKLKQLPRGDTWVTSTVYSASNCSSYEFVSNSQPNCLLKGTVAKQQEYIPPLMDSDREMSPERLSERSRSLASSNMSLNTFEMSNIPTQIQNQIQEILANRPNGIWASRLPFEYKSIFKKELQLKTYGYNSVVEFASDLPHIVRVERPHPEGDWHLLPAGSQRSAVVHGTQARQPQVEAISVIIDQVTKEKIVQVLCACPDGIALDKFEQVYEEMTGESVYVNKYGGASMMELLSPLTDILVLRLNSTGKYFVNLKDSATPRNFGHLKDQYQPTVRVDNSVGHQNFDQIKNQYQPSAKVDKQGSESYRHIAVGDSAHYISSSDSARHISSGELTHHISNSDPAHHISSSDPAHQISISDSARHISSADSARHISGSVPAPHIPSDAIGHGVLFTPQPVPDSQDEPNFIKLVVSYVVNPALFWIQLKGRETTHALEELMDDLEDVYKSSNLSSAYSMTTSLAKLRMVCAVIFPEDGNWHRGIIIGIKDFLYEVYYVDYGNVCHVTLAQMRLLKSQFLKLPAQAIQATLSNIKPVDGTWKPKSRERLLELSRGKPLVGLVTEFKNRIVSLCLTDTTHDFDIHINDVFVKEGYATFVMDTKHETTTEQQIQAPSIELVFGKNKTLNVQESRSTSSPISVRYVQQAQMMDDMVMNLINLDGHLYLMSSEISSLFFDEDVLSAQLYKDNTEVPKRVVTRRDHPDLFNELTVYNAKNLTPATNILSLFSLSALPLIIELYDKKGGLTEVKSTVLDVLEWFNPDDPYWKGMDPTNESSEIVPSQGLEVVPSQSSEVVPSRNPEVVPSQSPEVIPSQSSDVTTTDPDVPSLSDLQLVLNSLEIKKKRILKAIMMDSTSAPEYVNELNEAELNMKRVQALISKLENFLADSAPSQILDSSSQASTDSVVISVVNKSQQLHTVTSSQVKSTQKVAPTVQVCRTEQEMNPTQTAAADMTTLLQQHILLNSLMMEQLGISQEVGNLPLSFPFGQSFGRGINVQQYFTGLPLQTNNSTTTFTQSFHNPLLPLAGLQPFTANLPQGLGRGSLLDMYNPQQFTLSNLVDQSQLLQMSILQHQENASTRPNLP